MAAIKIHPSWLKKIKSEFETVGMKKLKNFLENEISEGKIIYPERKNYFSALNLTPLNQVKVVILGQDPYHGPGQAHGLCFSVPSGIRPPPSLKNIFKELKFDLSIEIPKSGNLTPWAQQGVLLLNSVLTVEKEKPGSHQKKGWETLTDKIISVVSEQSPHAVFILWGAYAQKKAEFVDLKKHLVIKNVHPSPLSSHRGFFGSKPFSTTNDWLKSKNIKPINWSL